MEGSGDVVILGRVRKTGKTVEVFIGGECSTASRRVAFAMSWLSVTGRLQRSAPSSDTGPIILHPNPQVDTFLAKKPAGKALLDR